MAFLSFSPPSFPFLFNLFCFSNLSRLIESPGHLSESKLRIVSQRERERERERESRRSLVVREVVGWCDRAG